MHTVDLDIILQFEFIDLFAHCPLECSCNLIGDLADAL